MVKKAIAAHGVPQRLLRDNGVALNPSRRGVVGQLVAYVRDSDDPLVAALREELM